MDLGRTRSLAELRQTAGACRACDLWRNATQVVFGEGPGHAPLMLVGEQPGDREDREGTPFVGPAGLLLDRALDAVGIERESVYVTNAVKHFKWTPRGKRRLHSKPNQSEVSACRMWLDAEIATVRPHVVVCMGATAARCLLGPTFRVTRDRGVALRADDLAATVVATVHPSSILRAGGGADRDEELRRFISDLEVAAALL